MKRVYEYSHLGGAEILQVRHPEIEADIHAVIDGIRGDLRTKRSKEKTKPGKMLYSPVLINKLFRDGLNARGFVEKRSPFSVELPRYPVKIKNAFKQIDFVKDGVLVEVQFGKYAFMFYDMAKFQYFYNDEGAEVGVEIVPCRNLQREMSSGVSYGEQLIGDIVRLRRHFPAVPVKVILVDVDEAEPLKPTDDHISEEETLASETPEISDEE
ncbi:MAG TPA: BglII/BstYI family type II restriction endonuclease [Candidatus Elarobacter sp.]|jgi:hypothetical protein